MTFTLDPSMTPRLRAELGALWADVANAGGTVGATSPVTADDVRPELVRTLALLAEGRARLLVGRDDAGRPVAMAQFTYNTGHLVRHWCWVHTVMVHPALQGRGHGRALMAAVAEEARAMEGVESLRLTCRGGLGLEDFYVSCGYREVGRVPRAIKVADDDLRDDVTLWLPLHGA